MKNIEGKLSIGCPRGGTEDGKIVIEVRDDNAVITFLKIKLSKEEFLSCIMGLSSVDCDLEVKSLDKVGKIREMDKIKFEMECVLDKRKEKAIEEAKKHTPEGWTADTYYGSQDSFEYLPNNKMLAKTTILRWVDKSE